LESRSHRQSDSHERGAVHGCRCAAAGYLRSLQLAVLGTALIQARADLARLKQCARHGAVEGRCLDRAGAGGDGEHHFATAERVSTNKRESWCECAAVAPELRDRLDAPQSVAVARRCGLSVVDWLRQRRESAFCAWHIATT